MARFTMIPMFVLISCFTSYGQKIDTSKITILPFDTADYWIFKDALPTTLTQNDLMEIEKLFVYCMDEYNVIEEKRFQQLDSAKPQYHFDKKYFIIDWKRYKRQYVAVINSKDEKEVYVNCFCSKEDYWKSDLVLVEDGGNCYFHFKINLTTKNCYAFSVNGVG